MLLRHRGGDEAGADGGDTHAAAAHLHAQALEVADRGGLRRAVRRRPRQPAKPRHRRDAGEGAGAAGAHRPHERMESVHEAEHVDVEDLAEGLDVFADRGVVAVRDPGVADHQVGRPVFCDEGGGRGTHGRRVAYVGCVSLARRGQCGPERLEHIAAACDQPQGRAARRVVARKRLTDAARGAGEEDLQLFFSLRAMPISWSTTWNTRSMLPACSALVKYFPSTATRGTLSTL